jgi:hypothetical protein
MKRIQLLSLPDPRFTLGDAAYESNRIDYASLVEQVLRVPLDRQGGASIEEMRRSIRVLDALDGRIGNVLELEDADWEHLKTKVERMPWAMIDRRLVQFYDDVVGATDAIREPAAANGRA